MSTVDIVQKLWNLCNVLRDDGITYHQYVTELTYILFLKMLDETGEENTLKADVLKAYQKSLEQYARKKGKAVEQLTEEEKESRKPLLYNYSWEYLTTLEAGGPRRPLRRLAAKERRREKVRRWAVFHAPCAH